MSATFSAAFTWHGASIAVHVDDGAALVVELKRFGIGGDAPAATEGTTAKNSPSSRATPARTEPTASVAAEDVQGKTAGASGQAAANAGAEPQVSTAATDFETLKKAFLALSTAPDGRTKCEAVLKPFGAAKLSALKPEQYGDAMAKINELGA